METTNQTEVIIRELYSLLDEAELCMHGSEILTEPEMSGNAICDSIKIIMENINLNPDQKIKLIERINEIEKDNEVSEI